MSINDNITGFAPAGQITPDPENTIDAPNTLTPDASTPIGTPDTVTPVGAGSITAPNTINPDAVNAVDAPNTLTPDAVNNVDTPNTLAPDAVNPIATPVGFAPLNSEPINRVLTPLIGLNFGSQNYSVMGQPSTFDNALTYSRASSASYVETYVDALNRKQKRITTVGANVPRFEDAGLLVEGASTNLHLNSEDFSQPAWTGTDAETIANQGIAPDGSLSADKLEANATGSLSPRIVDTFAGLSAGGNFTISVFVKPIEVSFFQIRFSAGDVAGVPRANFNLSSGTLGAVDAELTANIESIGNGWFRVSASGINVGTNLTPVYQLIDNPSAVGGGSATFTSGSGLLIWGGQIEQLPFATSYIRTEGSAVSRATDLISASASTSSEVTLHMDVKQLGNIQASATDLLSYGLDSTNRISLLTQPNRDIRFFSIVNGVTVTDTVVASSDSLNQNKITLTSKGGVNTGFINGESVVNDETGGFPTASNLIRIGSGFSGLNNMFGNIKLAQIYDTALTANEVKYL